MKTKLLGIFSCSGMPRAAHSPVPANITESAAPASTGAATSGTMNDLVEEGRRSQKVIVHQAGLHNDAQRESFSSVTRIGVSLDKATSPSDRGRLIDELAQLRAQLPHSSPVREHANSYLQKQLISLKRQVLQLEQKQRDPTGGRLAPDDINRLIGVRLSLIEKLKALFNEH